MRSRSPVVVLLALGVVAGALYFRGRPRPGAESRGEGEVVLAPVTEPTPAASPAAVASPAVSELQPTLDRVFGPILAVDPSAQPAFVTGDFNADGVTDLAVAVRPRSQDAVAAINADLTPWRRQDAAVPAAHALSRPPPVNVAAGERVLAVVHGVGADGWRNPEATQCYLVTNAVGAGMRRRSLTDMPAAVRNRALRTHVGDVILEQRDNQTGAIFWTSVAYAWATLEPGEAR